MSKKTISFISGPEPEGTLRDESADKIVELVKRVDQLESNILLFAERVSHVTFNVTAEDSALWMLDWEVQLMTGHLREEEDDASEQEPLEQSVVEEPPEEAAS